MQITLTINGADLTATLDDSAAAQDFAAMLPLELELTDYHGIEKAAGLPRRIDTSDAPGSYTPDAGDITVFAPWGNLAIFYKPFGASSGLVRLGEIDGATDALSGPGPVDVRISKTN